MWASELNTILQRSHENRTEGKNHFLCSVIPLPPTPPPFLSLPQIWLAFWVASAHCQIMSDHGPSLKTLKVLLDSIPSTYHCNHSVAKTPEGKEVMLCTCPGKWHYMRKGWKKWDCLAWRRLSGDLTLTVHLKISKGQVSRAVVGDRVFQ